MHTTFQALTDAVLPTGRQARGTTFIETDMGIHDYIIYELDHNIAIQQQLHHH
ncbi:hypothetical protein [Lentibacillus salicampi]|uniref:hypothetical protein n=1 Tax=Lentibacillus salicampi TaxID=175306 RepID=UPI001431C7CD|nr:hypothetical protein [Lentibacillus salicampi]